MPFSQKMRSLAFMAFFACVTFAAATEKESVCCREVSSKKLTAPITGFKVQLPRPPCVKAVIFYTTEGAVCSHWKETWVIAKVKELRQLQAIKKRLEMNTTTVTSQTTDSTYTYNTTSSNSTFV